MCFKSQANYTPILFKNSGSFTDNNSLNLSKTRVNVVKECNTVKCILNAMRTAQPGDEIVIEPGTYVALEKDNTNGGSSLFFSEQDGTVNAPIIIRAKDPLNPPILKGSEGRYDGYIMRILGDYWQIKNLILEDGSKGLVLDNANNVIIENITVRDIGEEGIHLRDGSSNNLVTGCNIFNTGVKKPGFGEGLYIGSDRSQHVATYNPDCNNNIIENCIIGPNVTAEAVDVKEGTLNTIIRNCVFSAKGISGENSADAFIDLKGAYTFVYNNTFNIDGSAIINAAIDFQDRKTDYNTGYRNAIFNNTFNLGNRSAEIPTMRAKGGNPSEIHFWNNTRIPNTVDPISSFSLKRMVLSCPSWNIVNCENNTSNTLPTVKIILPANKTEFIEGETIVIKALASDVDGTIKKVTFYSNNIKLGEDTSNPYEFTISNAQVGDYNLLVRVTDNEDGVVEATLNLKVKKKDNAAVSCLFNTPLNTTLPNFLEQTFFYVHVLGTGGPDLSNFKKFRIDWNNTKNVLNRFAVNTDDGIPSFYIDIKKKMNYSFNTESPELTISNSGIIGLDDSYWVTEINGDFVMVSKNYNFTLYFSNSATPPNCTPILFALKITDIPIIKEVKIYPNPVKDEILTIENLPKKEIFLTIVDLQGKVLVKQKNSKIKTTLNISCLKTGLYVVVLQDKHILKTMLFSKR